MKKKAKQSVSSPLLAGERPPSESMAPGAEAQPVHWPDRRAVERALTLAESPDADPLAQLLANVVRRLKGELRAANKGAECNMRLALNLIDQQQGRQPGERPKGASPANADDMP